MWASVIDRGVTILLTGSLLAFIEFLIKRHDDKKDKKDGVQAVLSALQSSLEALKADIDKKFRKSEKDGLRTQLLVLITMRPNEQQEILTISEHYFKTLHGDWYMTSLFNRWLVDSGIGKPEWFDDKQ